MSRVFPVLTLTLIGDLFDFVGLLIGALYFLLVTEKWGGVITEKFVDLVFLIIVLQTISEEDR